MSIQTVTVMYRNILETGTVTVTSENTSYPKYRLYDRELTKLFKALDSTSDVDIMIDQGAVISYALTRLIIPEGHNLNGKVCKLQYSTDGTNYSDALSWTQADALVINKTFTTQTKQYWRFRVTITGILQLGELYLTDSYVFTRNISNEAVQGTKRNVLREEGVSGTVRKVKLGESRRQYQYKLKAMGLTQMSDFQAWENETEGVKDFYILDHNGDLVYCEMLNELEFRYLTGTVVGSDLNLCEVLS